MVPPSHWGDVSSGLTINTWSKNPPVNSGEDFGDTHSVTERGRNVPEGQGLCSLGSGDGPKGLGSYDTSFVCHTTLE